MKKKLVYIACPYTLGDVAVNVHNAIQAANKGVELGAIPYIPIWTHFWHLVTPKPWEFWIEMDEYFVSLADIIWRLPGESKGADLEVAQALNEGKAVVYSESELYDLLDLINRVNKEGKERK